MNMEQLAFTTLVLPPNRVFNLVGSGHRWELNLQTCTGKLGVKLFQHLIWESPVVFGKLIYRLEICGLNWGSGASVGWGI